MPSNNALNITDSGVVTFDGTATFAGRTITGTTDFLTLTNGDGISGNPVVNIDTPFETTGMHGWNGSLLETAAVSAASDGATITFSVEKSGGGNLTAVFSDGYYDWTTAPDTVSLTPGTDTVPVLNYVYFLQSNKTLTVSTVNWPATEHAPLATVLCQTAATFQTDGAYKFHAWTDHVVKTSEQGHVGDLNFWIRQQPATWVSGVTQTYTITVNGGSADNVVLTTTAGVVLQLHDHTFPAFAGTPDLYVVNDSVTAYTKVTDLNALLTDSTGASMSGKYFSLVIWGCVSEDTGDCKLFVNLPGGSYNTQNGVLDDVDAFSNYTIPSVFRGTGFLISEWKLRHQAASSGTWTSIDEINLLGLFPSLSAGGSPGSITFTTDSGVGTPAANNINVVGGDGITTSATGDVVTITAEFGGFPWTDTSGAFSPLKENGYFITATATATLPASPDQGDTIQFYVEHATQDLTIQAAGTQIIRLGNTVSAATGTAVSTAQGDAIELVYRAVSDCWCAVDAVGSWNIT